MSAAKPAGLGPQYAAQFADQSVAAAYRHRPPYPAATFALLTSLLAGESRTVLDVGCGCGDLARPLAAHVDRIAAVDPSAALLALGRSLPGGAAPQLHWQHSTIEAATLAPPYALVTAAESLHWTDWQITLPRLRAALTPGGFLATVSRTTPAQPWLPAVMPVVQQYSTNRDFQPYDLIAELTQRRLFAEVGREQIAPVPFQQSVDDYIESWHSRNGLSRDRMTTAAAAVFDAAVRAIVLPYASAGVLSFPIGATVIWGTPLAGY